MKITEQQLLVLFDITKSCLYHPDKIFAGYSKEEIGRLLNDIINQQDNTTFIDISHQNIDNTIELLENEITDTNCQEKDLSLDNKSEEDFWDEKND